jgi:hypothetical protein
MFRRIEATKEANVEARRAEERFRATDDLERAKTHLRRRGFAVFNASVLRPGDKGICVGRRVLTPAQVIAMAERHGG